MTRDEWLEAFANELGLPPVSADDAGRLLDLAGIAAHASERTAAPLTAWLAGCAGVTPAEALEVARRLA